MNTPDSANLRSVGSPTMPLEPANSINSESQAPPGHHSESQAQAEPTEQIGHPLHVEEPVVCDSNPRVPSVLVTGQSASSVDFELKSWGRESPHSCTPSQEMEGYSDAPSRRCRTQSAPINEYTSGGVTRMLPMPSTQAECDRNHEIMKEFFNTYLVELPEEDFAFLGMKLLDCEYDKLLSNTNIMKGTITVRNLVPGLFKSWIRRTGRKADLHQVKCILKEIKNIDMCDRLDYYIKKKILKSLS